MMTARENEKDRAVVPEQRFGTRKDLHWAQRHEAQWNSQAAPPQLSRCVRQGSCAPHKASAGAEVKQSKELAMLVTID